MKDEDPYVRKTAAVCVAKLHDINASLVEEQGFVELLNDLLSDSNPMVTSVTVEYMICKLKLIILLIKITFLPLYVSVTS